MLDHVTFVNNVAVTVYLRVYSKCNNHCGNKVV